MAKINFSDLKLEVKESISEVKVGDNTIWVRNWLPMQLKEDFFNYVIQNSLDPTTNTFSPLRTEVYFAIAACQYYGQIEFTEEELTTKILDTYDALDSNGIIQNVIDNIDADELVFMQDGIEKICNAIETYSNSFAGQMSVMTSDADSFNKSVEELTNKIKNREGLELLEEIHALESK